ncbi:MAG: hypothetical protein GY934_11845 [Gammaproteobacteria bacterium]|nr:hypothetical protein [Gammaproteobacteria bacterium]
MKLNIILDDYSLDMDVDESFITSNTEAFDSLDSSMDQGIQLGREWVEAPDKIERCQFAANKLLSAIESHNERLAMISAGYILTRLKGVQQVTLNNEGNPGATSFE